MRRSRLPTLDLLYWLLGKYLDVRGFFSRDPSDEHHFRQISGVMQAVRDSFKEE